jgi:cell division protein ZapA
MPEVSLLINGRPYRVACGDGEEARLERLAQDLDRRVGGLVRSFGQASEGQLLVMAALILADELDEARAGPKAGADTEAAAAAAIDRVAERIEAIAVRLDRA